MKPGIFLAKPEILRKKQFHILIMALETEGFEILDACLIRARPDQYVSFLRGFQQPVPSKDLTAYSAGRAGIVAVTYLGDEHASTVRSVEAGTGARHFPGEYAIEYWFGKLQK